jgi:hypothetical protein
MRWSLAEQRVVITYHDFVDEHRQRKLPVINYALKKVARELADDGVSCFDFFSDTCADEFRGADSVYCNVVEVCDELRAEGKSISSWHWHYFYPNHGKHLVDGHFARIKQYCKKVAKDRNNGALAGVDDIVAALDKRKGRESRVWRVPDNLPKQTKANRIAGVSTFLYFQRNFGSVADVGTGAVDALPFSI